METVEALHPDPTKTSTRVSRDRYEAVRDALLAVIPHTEEGVRFSALRELVAPHLPDGQVPRGGKVGWWVTTVKLDLEARGLIERVPKSSPQRLRKSS